MKLSRLTINNFCGIQSADIDLSEPLNIFMGPNGSGKSSIRDAIEFVLTGGYCHSRGVGKKNQASCLATRSGGNLKVELQNEQGVYARSATRGNGPEIDATIARILCYPQAVLHLEAAQRQKLFAAISATDQSTTLKIEAFVTHAGCDTAVAKEILQDADKAEAVLVERRRVLKRQLPELFADSNHCEAPTIELAGKTVHLKDITAEAIKGWIHAAEKSLAESMKHEAKDEVSAESLQARQAELKQRIAGLPDQAELEAAVTKAKAEFVTVEKQRTEGDRIVGEAQAELKMLQRRREQIDQADGVCPITEAQCEILTGDATGKMLSEIDKQIKTAETDLAEARTANSELSLELSKKADALRNAKTVQSDMRRFGEQWNGELDDIAKQLQVPSEPQKQPPKDIRQRIDNLKTLEQAWAKWDQTNRQRETAKVELAKIQSQIGAVDTVVQALKPDGEMRKMLSATVEGVAFDAELSAAWGMESLKLESDGAITLHGAPIESACTTEIYRASVLLAEALARLCGMNLLMLDNADVLVTPDLKNALFGALVRWANEYDSILAFAATAERPSPVVMDRVGFHWVDNGMVKPMT